MATALDSMNLRPELVAACRKQGFRDAMPIQALVIPFVLQGQDVVVEAKTGSGKTLAYGLPLLQAQPSQMQFPEALVLVPTRELAAQVHTALTRTAGTLPRKIVALTGGGGMDRQEAELQAGAQIVVATMGRLEELLARGLLKIDHVRALVLDEVDELMQGGFSGNLATLLKQMPARRLTLLFSATISREIDQVARQFMRNPKRLQLSAAREIPAEISHRVLRTTVKHRLADLAAFLRAERPYQLLLFCGTRHEAEEVQDALVERGFEARFFHGDLSPIKRRKLIQSFRDGELPILVATDLAARGLDLPGVDLVVNYSLPEGASAYLHRAGRTGRAGKPGVVVTLLIEQQQGRFENLKQTVSFQKVELRGDFAVVRPLKSREDRDLEFRRLPRRPMQPVGARERSRAPKQGSAWPERTSDKKHGGAPKAEPRAPKKGSAWPERTSDKKHGGPPRTGTRPPKHGSARPERTSGGKRGGPPRSDRGAGPRRKTRR